MLVVYRELPSGWPKSAASRWSASETMAKKEKKTIRQKKEKFTLVDN